MRDPFESRSFLDEDLSGLLIDESEWDDDLTDRPTTIDAEYTGDDQ